MLSSSYAFRRRVVGVLLGAGVLVAGTTGSAFATGLSLPGGVGPLVVNVDTGLKETCKSVLLLAATTPTVTVNIGGKPTTIDVSAFASANVQICVRAKVNAVITVNVDATNPLCPIATGNIQVNGDANIFVKIDGLSKDQKPITVTTGNLVGPVSGNIPFLIVVCDP